MQTGLFTQYNTAPVRFTPERSAPIKLAPLMSLPLISEPKRITHPDLPQ